MKSSLRKKLISVVLTLAMVLGLLPAVSLAVYADGNLDSGFQLFDPKVEGTDDVIAKWNSDKTELIIFGKGQIDRDKWIEMAKLINSKYGEFGEEESFWGYGNDEVEENFDIKFESESDSDRIKLPVDSSYMFEFFSENIDFGTYGVDTSEVEDMSAMFADTENFNSPVDFDTKNVLDMAGMFIRAKSFNQPVNFDTRKVTSMNYMFNDASAFNQNIDFNISNCDNIKQIFYNSGINNKYIILRNSENSTDINAAAAFGYIKPSYLEFSGLRKNKINGYGHDCFSGDYKVEEDGVVVAEHKANEGYEFKDNAHYRVYLQSGEGIPEGVDIEENEVEEKIEGYIDYEWDNLKKYNDGKPFAFEDLKLSAISKGTKLAGKFVYDKVRLANFTEPAEFEMKIKFVPDDNKYAKIKDDITLTIKENPLKSSFRLNDAKTVFAKFDKDNNILITGYGHIDGKYWTDMAQMINKKYFTSSVIGWDKNTVENFDIIIKPDSGKQISTVMTMYIPNNFVGGFEGFSGNIIFDKNFIFERKGHDGNMLYTFRDATKFNQDLSHWDFSKPVMLDGFFEGAREFDNKGKQFVLDLKKYTENDLYVDYKFQDMFKGTKIKDLKVINNADKNMDGSYIFNGMNSVENLEFNG